MKKITSFLVVLLLMLASFTAGMEYPRGDVNYDGQVSISDVTFLIDYLLAGTWGDEPYIPQDETFTVNGVSFTMVAVEGGTFTMGATPEQGSDAYSDESPTHQVTLSSFCIGKTEVTQALWQTVMGTNPSLCQGDQNRPVEQVTWEDCQTFISKLNELTGRQFRVGVCRPWRHQESGLQVRWRQYHRRCGMVH